METLKDTACVEQAPKKKKGLLFALIGAAVVAAGVLAFIFWPRPLVTAPGYIAADLETAELYTEEGTVRETLVRGTPVIFVVEEEDKDYPGMVRLVMGEDDLAYLKKENLTEDPKAVVTTKAMYVRTPVNLTDETGAVAGQLVDKGQELTVIGFDKLDAEGKVVRYIVRAGEAEGYVRAGYVTRTVDEANAQYDAAVYQMHVDRGDDWGGGDAAGLDYFPREKAKFADNVMPEKVKALYLNVEFIGELDTYLDIADSSGINAFVIDIQDGGAIGYDSPTMQKYSPSAYSSAYNTLSEYQAAVKKIKDAGYYVIGRITAFNDPNMAADHPEHVIASTSTGNPQKIVGMYWPSVYSRYVWQYKVDLALEAVELMGFNEIQFDYVRFPDGTWYYEDWELDYRNTYNESKAQAVQRFLMYAADRLHDAGVYVSADVFGECAESYVCSYGQYWPAISNVVDVISAMPYPDHYSPSGSWLPWEHPYDTLYGFGSKAAQRQTETASPAVVRTWIQCYNAIVEPYTYYGPSQVADQIQALEDTGNTGGYMTWHGASSTGKYYSLIPAFD